MDRKSKATPPSLAPRPVTNSSSSVLPERKVVKTEGSNSEEDFEIVGFQNNDSLATKAANAGNVFQPHQTPGTFAQLLMEKEAEIEALRRIMQEMSAKVDQGPLTETPNNSANELSTVQQRRSIGSQVNKTKAIINGSFIAKDIDILKQQKLTESGKKLVTKQGQHEYDDHYLLEKVTDQKRERQETIDTEPGYHVEDTDEAENFFRSPNVYVRKGTDYYRRIEKNQLRRIENNINKLDLKEKGGFGISIEIKENSFPYTEKAGKIVSRTETKSFLPEN